MFQLAAAGGGDVFVNPDRVRFFAPDRPGATVVHFDAQHSIHVPKPLRKYTEGCPGMPHDRHRSLSDL